MKKAISVFLIVLTLINLITITSYADETEPTTEFSEKYEELKSMIPDATQYYNHQETKTATVTDENGISEEKPTTATTYTGPFVFSVLSHFFGVIPQVANQVMEFTLEAIGAEKNIKHFTIYDTVMGNYELFNITYNDVPTEITSKSTMQEVFKYQVMLYFFKVRNISIALSLFVLIYVGIRMAISTVAEDKAKYKNMIIAWASSLIILIFMHVIIIMISEILNEILEIIRTFANNMEITDQLKVSEIESQIFTNASKLYGGGDNIVASGWNLLAAVFTMWILVYYQLKFFIMYMRRIVEIGFLIIISPLVTVTYSIDKMGDGKAQAFATWLNELLMKAVIQVIHAVLYLIFIASAGYIATQHPLLAAVFFAFLGRSEKIIKNALSVKNDEFERAKVPFANN